MKKILFVINTLGRGGAEAALIQLIKRFDASEYELYLYVILEQGELIDRIPDNVVVLNKNFDSSSVLSKEGKKRLRKNIINILFRNGSILKNVFYLIGHSFRMLFNGKVLPDKLLWKALSDGCLRFDTKYDMAIAYIEGASAYYVRDHVKADKKVAFIHVNYCEAGYNRKMDKDAYVDFDKIFTVSDDVKDSFLSVYPECSNKTDIFENLIDREEIIKKSLWDGGFTDEFNGKRILTIARLTKQKALDVSIETCKMLKDKGEKIRWYVLGDGDLRNELEELIKENHLEEDFILLGVKDNPYTYLRQCDLYVHASRYEGKSIAIREAQILSKPIIVSDCKSNLEQVLDGKDALVSILDCESLKDKIETLLHNESLSVQLSQNAGKKYLDITDDTQKLFSIINQ